MGPETRGLPDAMLDANEHNVRIPIWGEVRSLNLSTATGILLFEALRQTGLIIELALAPCLFSRRAVLIHQTGIIPKTQTRPS